MHQSRLARNVSLGVKNLLLHALRSMLTMLGIILGVGSVISMLAIGEGASAQAMEQIRLLGSNNVIVRSQKPAEQEQQSTERVRVGMYGLTYDDYDRLSTTLPHVRRVVPAKVVRRPGFQGERTMEMRLVGTTPDWFDLVRRPLLAGRQLAWRDMEEKSAVIVLTEHGARRMLVNTEMIGQPIRIGNNSFRVIGIVETATLQSSMQAPDEEIDAYAPLNVVRNRFGDISFRRTAGGFERERVELHQVLVEIDEAANVEPTAGAITHMLQRFHRTEDYRVDVPLALLRQAEQTQRMWNIVLGSIAGISLLVGGIGIMNIMLATVTERTREIGVRRAIGAKKRQIIGQFLIETTVLSVIGGLVGIALGVTIPWGVEHFAGMPTAVRLWTIILSMGISVSIGVLFGLYPAVRAANLDPIEALRHE